MDTKITPDWFATPQPFRPSWRGIGNVDQFRWLSRADILRHLEMARDELGLRHVRAAAMYSPEMQVWGHSLADWAKSGTEKQPGANWQLIDLNIENLLEIGLKPIYTTCFTPLGFTDEERTCWPDRNPIGMPRDLDEWANFVAEGIRHHQKRYGPEELRSWYFECWNEPNLSTFFANSKEDFFRLWSATWRAVKSVDPELRFGGPSTARGEWVPEFLDWATAERTLPDYIITHLYNNDSEGEPLSPFDGPASHRVKDSPHFAAGVIRGLRTELNKRGFQGEIHWNEWGRSWFPHDPARETALEPAFIVKTMIEVSWEADYFAYWCLSDIYNQVGLQSSEFQAHYGLLSLHGLRKPGWFAHVLLDRVGNTRLPVSGTTPRISAVASNQAGKACVLISTYPETPGAEPEPAIVRVTVPSTARNPRLTRLGSEENNVIAAWRKQGAPAYPTPAQIDTLRTDNHLVSAPTPDIVPCADELEVVVHLECPGVAYLEIDL